MRGERSVSLADDLIITLSADALKDPLERDAIHWTAEGDEEASPGVGDEIVLLAITARYDGMRMSNPSHSSRVAAFWRRWMKFLPCPSHYPSQLGLNSNKKPQP